MTFVLLSDLLVTIIVNKVSSSLRVILSFNCILLPLIDHVKGSLELQLNFALEPTATVIFVGPSKKNPDPPLLASPNVKYNYVTTY